MVSELVLERRLESGTTSVSCQLRVIERNQYYDFRPEYEYSRQSYDLRTGGEITVPLWTDLHLRADIGREIFGERPMFIDLKLVVSTRSQIFPKLKWCRKLRAQETPPS